MTTMATETPQMTADEALHTAQECVGDLLRHLTPNMPFEFEQGWRSQPIQPDETPLHLVRIAAAAPVTTPDFPDHESLKVIAYVVSYSNGADDLPNLLFGHGDALDGGDVFARAVGHNSEKTLHDGSMSRSNVSIAGNPAPMPRGGDLPNGLHVKVANITATFTLKRGDDSDVQTRHFETVGEYEARKNEEQANAARLGFIDKSRPRRATSNGLAGLV